MDFGNSKKQRLKNCLKPAHRASVGGGISLKVLSIALFASCAFLGAGVNASNALETLQQRSAVVVSSHSEALAEKSNNFGTPTGFAADYNPTLGENSAYSLVDSASEANTNMSVTFDDNTVKYIKIINPAGYEDTVYSWDESGTNTITPSDTLIKPSSKYEGDYIGNSASNGTVFFWNSSTPVIKCNFIWNTSNVGQVYGHMTNITSIIGDFIGNVGNSGSAIHLQGWGDYTSSNIQQIVGDFIGNVTLDNNAAIQNTGAIHSLTGNFLYNIGGGISNSYSTALINLNADNTNILFRGNATSDGNLVAVLSTGSTNHDGQFNLNASVGNNITFDDMVTGGESSYGTHGMININRSDLTYNTLEDGATTTNVIPHGGEYIFNNALLSNDVHLYNGAKVKLGSNTQNGVTYYGYIDNSALKKPKFSNDENGGIIDSINNHIELNKIGAVTLNSDLELKIDMQHSDITADNYTMTSKSGSGNFIIKEINELGERPTEQGVYRYNVLQGTNAKLQLDETLAKDWAVNITTTTTVSDEIKTITSWNDKYQCEITDTTKSTKLKAEGKDLVYTVAKTSETTTSSMGDTLVVVNQAELDNRNFDAENPTQTYKVRDDVTGLGTTAAGTMNINGVEGSNTATIDLNNKTGFKLSESTTLNVNNSTITNASGDVAILNNSEAQLNLKNAVIIGDITNTNGKVTLDSSSTLTKLTNKSNDEGTTNAGTITTLDNRGTISNSGNVTTATNTNKLTNDGTITTVSSNYGTITNYGQITTVALNSGTLTNADGATIEDIISNTNSINNDGTISGNLTNDKNGIVINNGTITGNVDNAGILDTELSSIDGTINNTGIINLKESGEITKDVTGAGTMTLLENTNNTIGSNIENTIVMKGGELSFSNNITSLGGLIVSGSNSTLNLQNNSIQNTDLGNFTLNSDLDLKLDGNFANNQLDTITAKSFTNNGGNKINISNINILEPTTTENFFISPLGSGMTDSVRKNLAEAIQYTGGDLVYSPIFKYHANYDSENGMINFTRFGIGGSNASENFNPAVLTSSVAAEAGATAIMGTTMGYAFQNSDNFMNIPYLERVAKIKANHYALSPTGDATDVGTFSPLFTQSEQDSVWVKPYVTFENVPLKNGPKVTNNTYGTLIGYDTGLRELKHGWARTFTGYIGYNGAYQRYAGVSSNLNGGLIGGTMTLYKNNFFNATTLSTGAIVGENNNMYGHEDFTMLMAGVGNKTGYNLEFKEGKFIVQPNLLLSYTFVNTFDYHNAAGVKIESDPLHAIQVAPGVKFIGNLNNGWQPYVGVNMVWNLMGKSHSTANDVALPEMSIKPYVQYGVGIQKRMKDHFMAYGQAMIQNGGRNGLALTLGMRWQLENDTFDKVCKPIKKLISKDSETQDPKPKTKTIIKSL